MQSKPSAEPTTKPADRMAALQAAATEAFPEIFDPRDPKPLAVGVHRQLKDALSDISMTQIRAFLRQWTRRPAYLKAIVEGEQRLDLNAQTTEQIDPDHQRQAKEKLDKQRKPPQRGRGAGRGISRHPARQGRGKGRQGAAPQGGRPGPRSNGPRSGTAKAPVIVVKKRRVVTPA